MKYKNIELIDAELSCSVEFENPKESEKIVDNLVDEILNIFRDFSNEIFIEAVTDEIIEVRCWDITFDKEGVELLTKIYNKLVNTEFNTIQPKILIEVSTDDEWFKNEDGSEYNLDTVTMEEFLNNIEY